MFSEIDFFQEELSAICLFRGLYSPYLYYFGDYVLWNWFISENRKNEQPGKYAWKCDFEIKRL